MSNACWKKEVPLILQGNGTEWHVARWWGGKAGGGGVGWARQVATVPSRMMGSIGERYNGGRRAAVVGGCSSRHP